MRRISLASAWIAASLLVSGCADRVPLPADTETYWQVIRVEDERPRGGPPLVTLLNALEHDEAIVRAAAVRALGRLERSDLVSSFVTSLEDPDGRVRAEGVRAVAQASFDATDGGGQFGDVLESRFAGESDHHVRVEVLHSLGRLRYAQPERASRTAAFILREIRGLSGADRTHALRGVEDIVRRHPGVALDDTAVSVLADAAQNAREPVARRLAVTALVVSGHMTVERYRMVSGDDDAEVRRRAATWLRRRDQPPGALVEAAMADVDASVRIEGIRAWGGAFAAEGDCATLLSALRDPVARVELVALDVAPPRCAASSPTAEHVIGRVRGLATADSTSWHAGAHALVTLATADPALWRVEAGPFRDHPVWQVRMYLARAASLASDGDVLQALARDRVANVREVALAGLVRMADPIRVPLAIDALGAADYQLIRRAAEVVRSGRPVPGLITALLDALDRVTTEQRETSRDARLALLDAIADRGDDSMRDRLEPYLVDFDAAVAERAADVLRRWTGVAVTPTPTPPPAMTFPSFADLVELAETRVFMDLDAGTVELRLLPFDAPTNAARFARLARSGYFDGLTFHRVEPNFVIQGGSPGANEYWGDGPFTRDELSDRAHLRGTVGLSTRGRDTGDGQIFVNLVDNYRLDHTYTIFGEVVMGMELLDRLLEGATIRRMRTVAP